MHLLEGVATPLVALHMGQLAAGGLSSIVDAEALQPLIQVAKRRLDVAIAGLFLASVLIIAIVCLGYFQQQAHLAYVAIFGVAHYGLR